jgi:hypothetical protein
LLLMVFLPLLVFTNFHCHGVATLNHRYWSTRIELPHYKI